MSIKYTYVTDDKTLQNKLELFNKYDRYGVDIETTGGTKDEALDPKRGKIRLIQISSPDQYVLEVDWFKISGDGKNMVKQLLEAPEKTKIFHNAKFDIKFLLMNDIHTNNVMDTMLMAGVLEAGLNESLKLGAIASRYLNLDIDKEEQLSDWSRESLSREQLAYAAVDAGILIPLADELMKELDIHKLKPILDLERQTIPAIVEMELQGIKVDAEGVIKVHEHLQGRQKTILDKLQATFGDKFNPNSPKQLLEALAAIGIEVENTARSTLSWIKEQHQVIKTVMDYRDITKKLEFAHKIIGSIDSITGRVHSSYFQLGAATGRLSCANFNLQQVPRDELFRACFIPDEGNVFVIADYSQIQIRIAAEYSHDPLMRKVYETGEDLHRITASIICGKDIHDVTSQERSLAKAVNFGMMFGMGASSLVEYAWNNYQVKINPEEAMTFISKFYQTYEGYKSWQDRVTAETLHASRTIMGRRRLFTNGGNYTQLINTPIQGTEGDILKTALSRLFYNLKATSGVLVATIHDEIIVECKEIDGDRVAAIVKGTLEQAGKRFLKTIPVVADASIATSWAEK